MRPCVALLILRNRLESEVRLGVEHLGGFLSDLSTCLSQHDGKGPRGAWILLEGDVFKRDLVESGGYDVDGLLVGEHKLVDVVAQLC